MGAELNTRSYPAALGRAAIEKKWADACDASRYESGHSHSGEIGMLQGTPVWHDEKCASRKDANEFICENQEKFSGPLAVTYTDKEVECVLIGGWCSS